MLESDGHGLGDHLGPDTLGHEETLGRGDGRAEEEALVSDAVSVVRLEQDGVRGVGRHVGILVRRDVVVRVAGGLGLSFGGVLHDDAGDVQLVVGLAAQLRLHVLQPYRADGVVAHEVARLADGRGAVGDDRGVVENLTGRYHVNGLR